MIFGTNLKIYNAKNDLVDLDDLDSIFSVSPEGFGASIENNIFNAGASFKSSGVDMKASSLKLNLYFGLGDDNSEMVEYRKFVEFLNYPPYRLVYITEETELFRDCILNEITKSDINTNQVLLEQVIFDFLTPFYKEISETYKPNSDTEGDGKIYTGTNKPRNLIVNPNFLNNMQDWANMSDPEGTYQLQVPASDKPNSNILKLTSSNNKLSSFLNAWGLKVRKGDRLSFRVDIKTENSPDYDRPVIRVVCGTDENNYKYSDFGITSSSSGFKTATISFVVPEDGVFQLYLINQNWSTIGEMSTYFREPMLIRGDVSDMPVEQYDASYPNLNLLEDGKFAKPTSPKWNTDGTTILKDNITGYFKVIFNGTGSFNRAYYTAGISTIPIGQKYSVYIKAYSLESSLNIKMGTADTSQTITVTNNNNIPKTYKVDGLVRGNSDSFGLLGGLKTTLGTLFISEIKLEQGSTATPWMPLASEATINDYPKYVGFSNIIKPNKTNSDYKWLPIGLVSIDSATGLLKPAVIGIDYAQAHPVGSIISNSSSSASGYTTGTWQNIGSAVIGSTTIYYWKRTA